MAPGNEAIVSTPVSAALWELTRAAVMACASAADAYLARGGWAPRWRLATVDTFASGWPNLSRPFGASRDSAPVQHARLFGQTRGQLVPISYDDVPELVTLIEHVRHDDLLAPRVIPDWVDRDEFAEQMLKFQVARLPLSLLDRARALRVSGNDALLALYLERERAWLADPLPVEYVLPLALTALRLDEPLQIAEGIRIDPLRALLQAARAPESRSGVDAVPSPVVDAATHAIVLTGREIDNPGVAARMFSRRADPLPALEDADLVCEALRVLAPADVGYAQVLRRPVGWADDWEHDLPPVDRLATLRRYPERFDDYGWLTEPSPIDAAIVARLPSTAVALRDARPAIRLASRRLSLAALRDSDEDRTVDACIGLEALLGEGQTELKHRLSLRAATALAGSPTALDPKVVYELMRKVYDHRSAVVHGSGSAKNETVRVGERNVPAADVAVILLRNLIDELLERPRLPAELDAELLDRLRTPEEPGGVDARRDDE